MARNRNTIAPFVSFNMQDMAAYIQGMSDEQLGSWFRKAVIDCCSGCIDPKTDCFIRDAYNKSFERMTKTQDHNSSMYQNRLRRNQEFNDQEDSQRTITPMADGDIREDSLNNTDGSDAVQLESGPSANIYDQETAPTNTNGPRQAEDRQSQRTGGTPKGFKRETATSQAETFPVRSSPEKKPYGPCGNVTLSDADGHHLREVYGEDLWLAISILDSTLENNPKLKKRYKNHAAVLRYGNWVWQEVQKIKERQVRLETAEINKMAAEKRAASGDGRTFKQKDRDDRSGWLHSSLFETPEAANG